MSSLFDFDTSAVEGGAQASLGGCAEDGGVWDAVNDEGEATASMGGCAEDDGFFAPGALQRGDEDEAAEEMPFHKRSGGAATAVPLWGASSGASSSSSSSINSSTSDPSNADCSMPSPSHVMQAQHAQQAQHSNFRTTSPPVADALTASAAGCGGFSMDTAPPTSTVVAGQQHFQPSPFRSPAAASASRGASFQLGSRLSGGGSSGHRSSSSSGGVVARRVGSGGTMQRHAHTAAPSSPATSDEAERFKDAAQDLLTTFAKLTIEMNESALSAQRNKERESSCFKALERTQANAARAIASTRSFDCIAIVAALWKDDAAGAAGGAQ